MKKVLFGLLGAAAIFTGCKENNPRVTMGTASVDTTYVGPVPGAEARNVLVEEFTGQSCANCPSAHDFLETIAANNPGRVNIIGMYIYGPIQGNPPHGAAYDLRDSAATQINQVVYLGFNNLPSGGVNRTTNAAGDRGMYQSAWNAVITSEMAAPTPVNLNITSSFNDTRNEATIVATIKYSQAVSVPQNLSIIVVEDSIIDVQEYPPSGLHPSGYDEHYVFTNVFRGSVTAVPFGDPILATVPNKEAGRAVVRSFKYVLSSKANSKHCRVIAFVSNNSGTDYSIVQSTQTKLVP